MELADRKPFFEEGVQKLQNEGYRNFGEISIGIGSRRTDGHHRFFRKLTLATLFMFMDAISGKEL
jgi:hypothetical protein